MGRNNGGVTPQPLQVIVRARAFGKDVDQKIAVIHEDPLSRMVAFDADGPFTLFLQLFFDLVRDGLSLAGIGNGADDEEIGKRSDWPEIEDQQVCSFFGFRSFRGHAPVEIRALGGNFGMGANRNDGAVGYCIVRRR